MPDVTSPTPPTTRPEHKKGTPVIDVPDATRSTAKCVTVLLCRYYYLFKSTSAEAGDKVTLMAGAVCPPSTNVYSISQILRIVKGLGDFFTTPVRAGADALTPLEAIGYCHLIRDS